MNDESTILHFEFCILQLNLNSFRRCAPKHVASGRALLRVEYCVEI